MAGHGSLLDDGVGRGLCVREGRREGGKRVGRIDGQCVTAWGGGCVCV